MNNTVIALLGYISWTILLLGLLAGNRAVAMLSTKRAINSFAPDGKDVSPLSNRIARAHANCYECFPIVGGLLLLALATGSTAITSSMALIVLGTRIVQSIVHIISTSAPAVRLRFACLLVQLGIAGCWIAQLLTKYWN